MCIRDRRSEIFTVAMQQVESIIRHAVGAAILEVLLQPGKARNAVFTFHYQFAVDQCSFGLHGSDSIGDSEKFFCPVKAAPGQQLDLALGKPRLDSVAVEFDLMDPVVALRRAVGESGETGLNKSWQGARARFLPRIHEFLGFAQNSRSLCLRA